MSADKKTLDDYLELITYGFTNPMPDADEGPWKITAKDIINGKINFNTSRKTTKEAFDKKLTDKSRPQIGDVLLTKDGTLGRLAVVRQENICVNQSVAVLRPNKKILPDYLFYLLSTPFYQQKMIGDSDGTVIKHIYITRVGKMMVEVPSIAEQGLILRNLQALDKKITLNTQTNQTLEQIAQAIFKSWFVDFDPVKAKMTVLAVGGSREDAERAAMSAISGKDETQLSAMQREQPAAYAELAATAALFPVTMQASELGEIPEGWYIANLASLADVIMGQSPKGDSYNDQGDGICLVNGPVEFGDRHPKQTKWTTAPNKLSKKNDLIVCVRGSTTGKFVKSDGEYCLGRGVCAIRSEFQTFVDELFKLDLEKLLMLTTGSTFPNWSRDSLSNHKFVKPSDLLLSLFSEKIGLFSDRISSNSIESEQLSLIRDSLLPKLLSGEIDLSNLPDPAEAA